MFSLGRQLIEGTHLASIHDTGIGILAEGGLQHLGMLSVVSMSNEVNGLCGTTGDQYTVLVDVVYISQLVFQRVCLGFGIVANHPHPIVQVGIQSTQICMTVDVGAEIHHNGMIIAIAVVTVSSIMARKYLIDLIHIYMLADMCCQLVVLFFLERLIVKRL